MRRAEFGDIVLQHVGSCRFTGGGNNTFGCVFTAPRHQYAEIETDAAASRFVLKITRMFRETDDKPARYQYHVLVAEKSAT